MTGAAPSRARLLVVAVGLVLLGLLGYSGWRGPDSSKEGERAAQGEVPQGARGADPGATGTDQAGATTERPSPEELPEGWEHHRLQIKFSGDEVTLSGTVPSDDEGDDLIGMAQGIAESVVDELEILGEHAPPDWYGTAQVAIGLLEQLEYGSATVTPTELIITGRARDGTPLEEIRETVQAQLASHVTARIDIDGAYQPEVP